VKNFPFWYPPILNYHRVSPILGSDTPTVSVGTFEKQMKILAQRWKPISLADLVQTLEQGSPLPAKAVVVTFDDGTEDNFHHAFASLSRYQIPATIFLITGNVGKSGSLHPDQIRQMREGNVRFGSHTDHHAYLPKLSLAQVHEELKSSRAALQNLGVDSDLLSYPAGGFSPEIILEAQKAGFRAACTTSRGTVRFPPDRWALRRITLHENARSAFDMWIRCSGFYPLNRRLRAPF